MESDSEKHPGLHRFSVLSEAVTQKSTNDIITPVLVLVGPTAVGKTALSIQMARRFSCEIVSVDSMQVYRYMDIGTAKPSVLERKGVTHHLLDIIDPDEQYNSARFVQDTLAAIEKISSSGRIPLLTGGTGLYLKALTEGLFELEGIEDEDVRDHLHKRFQAEGREALYHELRQIDPVSAGRIHINDTQRLIRALEIFHSTGQTWSEHLNNQPAPVVNFVNLLQLGLKCDREILYDRIEQRTLSMFRNGLVEEAEKLQKMGYSARLQSMQAIGYRHVNNYLAGDWDREDTILTLIRDTRRYAKRQMTWFSRNESIQWFERTDHNGVLQATDDWLCRMK